MRPINLILRNFLSHKESKLDFTRLAAVTLLVGETEGNPEDSNGAGKSSVFDGMLFALFGQCRKVGEKRGLNINHVVRDGADRAEVIFTFDIKDVVYRVTRRRLVQKNNKGRSEVILQVRHNKQWQLISGDGVRETDKKIIQLIGVDYNTFVNTVLFPQGDGTSFAAMGPNERKDVVRSILGLEQYDVYEEAAKDRAKQYDAQLQTYDAFFQQHIGVEDALAEQQQLVKTLTGVIMAKQQHVATIEASLERLREEMAHFRADVERRQELQKLIEGLSEDVSTAITAIEIAQEKEEQYRHDREVAQKRFQRFNDEIKTKAAQRPDRQAISVAADSNSKRKERWTQTVDERKAAVFSVDGVIKSLCTAVHQIEELAEGQCPTCHSVVTEESKERAALELQAQIAQQRAILANAQQLLEQATDELNAILAEEEELKARAEEFNTYVRELRLLQEQAKSAKERYEGLQTMLIDVNELVKQHEAQALHAQESLENAQRQLTRLGDIDEERYREVSTELSSKGEELQRANRILQEKEVNKRVAEETIRTQQAIVDAINKKHEQCVTLERKRRIYCELATAFGKKGIQAIILENSTVELEAIANDILLRLTGGRVQIEIQTQRESSTNTIQEVFDILIKSNQRVAPFDLYSGGEGLRIAFAIRIALSMLLARRAGTQISTLWYDEAFAQLDGKGRTQLIEAFDLLTADFDHQLVISHRTDLKSEFEDVVIVKKQGDNSTILQ